MVLLDINDGFFKYGSIAHHFSKIFRVHSNRELVNRYPNLVPWAFGLSNRIIKQTKLSVQLPQRVEACLSGFRVKHESRSIVEKKRLIEAATGLNVVNQFEELSDFPQRDVSYWKATGRRHDPRYFKRLARYLGLNSVGGTFWPKASYSFISRVYRKLRTTSGLVGGSNLLQFDSWRFWEGLASGSCVIHFDLDSHNAILPVQPISGTHYIGLFKKPDKFPRFSNDDMVSIAKTGRDWAFAHYSPRPLAERLLKEVSVLN